MCLLVRDGAYQLKKISARYRDWHYHDYRHTDIDKFILAAEELTKRGYYVFRMGVIVEKPFKSEKLFLLIERALENAFLKKEYEVYKNIYDEENDIIGSSKSINIIKTTILALKTQNFRAYSGP